MQAGDSAPSQVLVQQDYDCKMIWAGASLVVYPISLQ